MVSTNILQNKVFKWVMNTWKLVQHEQVSGKSKSKQQLDIITHPLEQVKLKKTDYISPVVKDMEQF